MTEIVREDYPKQDLEKHVTKLTNDMTERYKESHMSDREYEEMLRATRGGRPCSGCE